MSTIDSEDLEGAGEVLSAHSLQRLAKLRLDVALLARLVRKRQAKAPEDVVTEIHLSEIASNLAWLETQITQWLDERPAQHTSSEAVASSEADANEAAADEPDEHYMSGITLDQLDKATRAAVLANTASRIAFRLDHDDATIVAKRSRGSLRTEDLAGLGPYEAYASLLVSGDAAPFGSIQTLPLQPTVRDPDTLKAQNRTRCGVEREVTETALAALLETRSTSGNPGPAGPLGGRKANPGDES